MPCHPDLTGQSGIKPIYILLFGFHYRLNMNEPLGSPPKMGVRLFCNCLFGLYEAHMFFNLKCALHCYSQKP